jgi:hypothetical protein
MIYINERVQAKADHKTQNCSSESRTQNNQQMLSKIKF